MTDGASETIARLRRLYAKLKENRCLILTTPSGDKVRLTFAVTAGHPQLEVVGATVQRLGRDCA